jgi:hypothetical protein
MAVTMITPAAAAAVSRLTCSPSSSADQPRVSAGCASCSRPTRATPPRASPAYQAKKPRHLAAVRDLLPGCELAAVPSGGVHLWLRLPDRILRAS